MGAAQLEVIAGNLRDEGDQHVLAGGYGGCELSGIGLNATADMAEEIQFPGGIEAGIVKAELAFGAGYRDGLGVLAGQ